MATIVPEKRHYSELISPGICFQRFYPGGKEGPNSEVLMPTRGGQVWSDIFTLGDEKDAFQLAVPDIRNPANQFLPLHWHDCWVGIVVLEGECLIGDWWMQPGDVLVAKGGVEYGPLLMGPKGCRLFEIFARAHLAQGGYAPEYRDHPFMKTPTITPPVLERKGVNKRNEGRSTLPIGGVAELTKGHLTPGAVFDLGERGDPERGLMQVSRLAPDEKIAPHHYDDWHALLVMEGAMQIEDRTLGKDDYLVMRPNCTVPQIEAGLDGVKLLALSRTARGSAPRPVS